MSLPHLKRILTAIADNHRATPTQFIVLLELYQADHTASSMEKILPNLKNPAASLSSLVSRGFAEFYPATTVNTSHRGPRKIYRINQEGQRIIDSLLMPSFLKTEN